MKRPLVLVSNDDGIEAAGVHRLVEWLSEASSRHPCLNVKK